MKLLFKGIIQQAILKQTSDVHFIPFRDEVVIKFRIGDELEEFERVKFDTYNKLLTYMKYEAGLDVSTKHKAQSGRYVFKQDIVYFLRISTLPLSLGIESCVIRITPQYFQDEKRYHSHQPLLKLMHKKQGLILFSGPTGAGKSTLMYQMVKYALNHLNRNIITIEDPVEQLIEGITQISVNDKAEIDYETSFKAILRCDPDIILIGEIRDHHIAKKVIQASLSGHLVLSTIHANDCQGVLLRLLEMGVTKEELKQAINQVTNQRLITTNDHERQLVYEVMDKEAIQYFLAHEVLPSSFLSIQDTLAKLNKEGIICEDTYNRYH
ncbi:competence type IV pilus ATPase ComGA [Staphylococcus massiliensis]|uniref:competence type IV pilus ATPase ComGA n=1 Tax=Staphylococcus massiliensis TaxID=555791 RepID=UPI001EE03553|nr:competence type IV pilus ATPase ComGA [Staphylococcus massiliensis]MCG3398979.1 Flp pilus assembly complex ATPase component TadA [Staphylococcus massiliensis]